MIASTPLPPRVVVYEGAGAEPLPPSDRTQLFAALLDRGYAVTRAGANAAGLIADAALVVIGRFAGPPPAVADDAGRHDVQVRSIAGMSVDEAVAVVEEARGARPMNRPPEAGVAAANTADTWKPWFPVIDTARCTNCMQCLSFCLFGVYGVDEGKRIQVQNNDNCKTNCPACSRVCPEAAIMFPKYKAGPINGDLVSDADLAKEKMKVDISALLGGDVYAMLRLRSEKAKSRFSKERDSDKALAERQKCLVKLAAAGDIPPEVLMSLPSPEEIARRAAEAQAKAEAARAG